MERRRHAHRTGKLWVLTTLGIAYIALLPYLHALTGNSIFDGSLGVFLGLYISAQPAGNAIDVLFFQRFALREFLSGWADVGWLGLNMLAMLTGMVVITLGAARFLEAPA